MNNEHDIYRTTPIYFGVSVWGREFCESFVNCALASLLAAGNIPALENISGKNLFIIFTTKEDWEWLAEHPLLTLLRQYMAVEFMEMPSISEEDYLQLNNALKSRKLYLMTLGHRQILNKMYEDKAVGSIVISDSIYSNNSIQSAYQHIANGKTAVMVFCPRFSTTSIIEELRENQYLHPDRPLSIDSRKLLEIAINNLHIDVKMQDWDAPHLPEFLFETSWRLPDEIGLLFHTWTCWYSFINYSRLSKHNIQSLDNNTIDGVYFSANLNSKECHFITDSDEFTLISFSPHIERKTSPIYRPFQTKKILERIKIRFAKRKIFGTLNMQTDAFKLEFAKSPIYLHVKDLTPSCVNIQNSAQTIMQKILTDRTSMFDRLVFFMVTKGFLGKVQSKIKALCCHVPKET